MNIIVNVLLNIIILRILCPLIVLAGAVTGIFYLFDYTGMDMAANVLRPVAELTVSFFRTTFTLLSNL